MKQQLQSRTCFKCGTDKTQKDKTKNGTSYDHWRHDKEGNWICGKCKLKQRRLDNPEIFRQYSKLWYLDNHNRPGFKDKRLELVHKYQNRPGWKAYKALYDRIIRPHQKQQQRIRRVIKRGWGWTS